MRNLKKTRTIPAFISSEFTQLDPFSRLASALIFENKFRFPFPSAFFDGVCHYVRRVVYIYQKESEPNQEGMPMNLTLPLDQMSTSDKLRAIEEIWDDLSRTAKDIPSPAWHEDVLRARDDCVSEGSSKYLDWGEAKKNIRDSAK